MSTSRLARTDDDELVPRADTVAEAYEGRASRENTAGEISDCYPGVVHVQGYRRGGGRHSHAISESVEGGGEPRKVRGPGR